MVLARTNCKGQVRWIMDWSETVLNTLLSIGGCENTVCCGNSGRKHKALNQGDSYGDGDKIYLSGTWRTYGLKKEQRESRDIWGFLFGQVGK